MRASRAQNMSQELEIGFPEMRYDITMPFFERRVKIDGVTLKPTKTTSMVFADNPQLREGDFGLCDLNLGYFLPAIDAGWQLIGLPVFSKRKPVYPYISSVARMPAFMRRKIWRASESARASTGRRSASGCGGC